MKINGTEYKIGTFGLLRADLHDEHQHLLAHAPSDNKARREELERLAAPIRTGRCIECDNGVEVYVVDGVRVRIGCECRS